MKTPPKDRLDYIIYLQQNYDSKLIAAMEISSYDGEVVFFNKQIEIDYQNWLMKSGK